MTFLIFILQDTFYPDIAEGIFFRITTPPHTITQRRSRAIPDTNQKPGSGELSA